MVIIKTFHFRHSQWRKNIFYVESHFGIKSFTAGFPNFGIWSAGGFIWPPKFSEQKYTVYSIYPKASEHPFKLVDLAILATPIADRCIKLSTTPCNLHRQTMAVEWPYWRAQRYSTWHRHRMPPFQQVSLSNFCPARAAPVNSKCCYCEVEIFRRNNGADTKW